MYKKIISIVLTLALLVTPTVALADSQTATSANADVQAALVYQDENMSRAVTSGLYNGGIYYIKNVNSGKYLNVHYGTDANGTNVYQWTKDNSTEQKFKLVYYSSADAFKIHAMCSSSDSNRVLDVARNGSALANGQNVAIWTPIDNTAQYMRFESASGTNRYRIVMKENANLALAAYGTSNGTGSGKSSTSAGNVFIKTKSTSDNSQVWELEYISGGTLMGTPATPAGHLDEVTGSVIRGWAWRSDIPNTPIDVHIYIYNSQNQQVLSDGITADEYRSDLQSAGYGNGNHGFTYSINWNQFPSGTYTVYAYGIGANNNNPGLSNCPKTYSHTNTGSTNVYRAMNWSYMFRTGDHATPYYNVVQEMKGVSHLGIDIAAPAGTPVYSTASGSILACGDNSSMGYYVVITTNSHDGIGYLVTRNMHFQSWPLVTENQAVNANTLIGYVGNTGDSNGDHLHFDVNNMGNWDGNTLRNNISRVINPRQFW